MNYVDIITAIGINLSKQFSNVYHSAELIFDDKGTKQPAISVGDEWIGLGPDQKEETVYIRRNGDDEFVGEMGIGSCVKAYKMRTPIRIVYFMDHAKAHHGILSKLMQASLIQGTAISRVIRDKFKLMKDETSIEYSMGASTAYFAIDLLVLWDLLPNNCDDDFCITLDNPINQCS